MGLNNITPSENIYLPSSFLSSKWWTSNQIADSLAIAAALGNPTFFITMTCNTNWPEIQSQLQPGQNFLNILVVVIHVFKWKLALPLKTLKTMFINAGHLVYCIHCIEFQKHGVPHAHILKFSSACNTPHDIDIIVSVEIPNDAVDANLVCTFMMHHHPSAEQPPSKYCQRVLSDGSHSCHFKYPHPLQQKTTNNSEGRVHYCQRNPGDEMVMLYCLLLLHKFQCHLNLEICSTSHIFQYLFKYIHKGMLYHQRAVTISHRLLMISIGPDQTQYWVQTADQHDQVIDEIEEYWQAQYLSAGEAVWWILGFHITKKEPSVMTLPIYLPGCHVHHQYHQT